MSHMSNMSNLLNPPFWLPSGLRQHLWPETLFPCRMLQNAAECHVSWSLILRDQI
jgi:hypothetical protein